MITGREGGIRRYTGRRGSRSRGNPDAPPVTRAPSDRSGIAHRSQGNPRGFPRETRVPFLMFAHGQSLRFPKFKTKRRQIMISRLQRSRPHGGSPRSSGRGAGISLCRSIRPRPASLKMSLHIGRRKEHSFVDPTNGRLDIGTPLRLAKFLYLSCLP